MKQKLNFLGNILLRRRIVIFLGLFILAVFLIQQQFFPNISFPFKNNTFSNSKNIALASPACNPDACAVYGTICCPGIESCIVWWEDENNCGRCGNRCPPGSTCRLNVPGDYNRGASCQGCDAAACGTYGLICCQGIVGCVNPWTDRNNCGGCGIRCGTGYRCSSGQCVDGTPPAISITNPQNGATVSGTVEIRADVADPQSQVEWVKFAVRKRPTGTATVICTDNSFPYSCSWNTTAFENGSYSVIAWARSAGGEATRSIGVTVSNIGPGPVCGNRVCESGENTSNCPADCPSACDPQACAAYGAICCAGITDCVRWWEDENNCGQCGRVCPSGEECRLNVPGDYTRGASCQRITGPDISTPSVSPFCEGTTSKATISWSGGDGSQGFWVDTDNDSNWGNGFWNKKVSSRSTTAPDGFNPVFGATGVLTLIGDKGYYVRIYDPKLDKHSPTTSFVAKNCGAPTFGRPTLLEPPNGAIDISNNPKFKWLPVSGAQRYGVWIGEDADFTTGPFWSKNAYQNFNCSPTACSIGWQNGSGWTSQRGAALPPPTLTPGKTYYWLVWACTDGSCPLSGVSQTWSFTAKLGAAGVNNPPNIPSRPSGQTSGQTNVSYTYTTSTTDPEGDQIKYGWDWDGDGAVDEWSDWKNSGLPDERSHSWARPGTYNIRAKAQDSKGLASDWSFPLRVEIRATLAAPSLQEPPNGAKDVSNNPTFKWSSVAGAGRYGIWVGESNNFSTAPFWTKNAYPQNCSANTCSIGWQNGSGWTSQRGAALPPPTLTPGKTYYWLVWACTDGECPLSGVSVTWSFTVAGVPPPPPPQNYIVQPFILFPSDVPQDPTIPPIVNQYMSDVSSWYGGQLGGQTFRLAPAITLIGTHPSVWFDTDLLGRVHTQFIELGYGGLGLRPGRIDAMFYVGGQPGWAGATAICGAGRNAYNPECDKGYMLVGSGWLLLWNSGEQNRNHWRYTVAHELGHTFSLPDLYNPPAREIINREFSDRNIANLGFPEPNGCLRVLMCGQTDPPIYPNSILLDQLFPNLYIEGVQCCPEKSILRQLKFFK
jgi:hypothetical protein